ncbi:hypothetical protein RND81_09G264000 [Saponaria officinalis]|uniref:Uncharacterized protein n=1 Tax=Saponaria officinalis TaxID=3572 RepID=A0AAW1ISE8_SAPOF
MRILLCKIQCPFICFYKPSSHIYHPGPLKLENVPHAQREISQTCDVSVDAVVRESTEPEPAQMKKVQWLDFLGKDLAEIQEFESRSDHKSIAMSGRFCFLSCLDLFPWS